MVLVLVSIRGDQEVNEVKLANQLSQLASQYDAKSLLSLKVADEISQSQWAAKPLPLGYIAPDLPDDYIAASDRVVGKFLRMADQTVVELKDFVTGANESGYHVVGANWGKEFTLPPIIADLRKARAGDRAVHNPQQTLKSARGIEVGHIFQLGTKYSTAMEATYTAEDGSEKPFIMGCYGIGVSRLAQAAVEQSHDSDGIIWPVAIAPYHVIIVIPNVTDAEQLKVAEDIYNRLNEAGIETLLDDRDERAGVKFKDADLIGIPYRLVTGRALKEGKVELVERATKHSQLIPIEDVVETLHQKINANSYK